MLTYLQIRDFQKHKSLVIELERVTTIVGPTEAGKSAVVRALRWLCLNRPSGDSFVRKGAKRAVVELEVDGHDIERSRSRQKNEYVVDTKSFVAFGRDTTPEVVRVIMRVDEANFQRQLDSPFWITATPGQVAKNLNAIVDLEIVDHSLASIGKMFRSKRAEYRVVRQRVKELKEETGALAFVPSMSEAYKHVQTLHTDFRSLEARRTQLDALVSNVDQALTRVQETRNEQELVSAAVVVGDRWSGVEERLRQLTGLLDSIDEAVRVADERKLEALSLEEDFHKTLRGRQCPLCHQIVE